MNVEKMPQGVAVEADCERRCPLKKRCPFSQSTSICMIIESQHRLVDIGHGHHVLLVDGADGEAIGLFDFHPVKRGDSHHGDGHTCVGYAGWRGENNARWDLEQIDPLTLSPSLLCKCGDHGFIRYGQWEVA